jgi:hypothetical protein
VSLVVVVAIVVLVVVVVVVVVVKWRLISWYKTVAWQIHYRFQGDFIVSD